MKNNSVASDPQTSLESGMSKGRNFGRVFLALVMMGMGVMHVVALSAFATAVPSYLPQPRMLVLVSGVFEVAGGVGLVVRRTRKAASIGLIALYLAVFPANVDMAIHADHWLPQPWRFLLWLRLPFQAGFIYWAWVAGRD